MELRKIRKNSSCATRNLSTHCMQNDNYSLFDMSVYSSLTVLPLRHLLNFETLRCSLREALISKLREMNNIKCQNLVIFSFKIGMKHQSPISVNQI